MKTLFLAVLLVSVLAMPVLAVYVPSDNTIVTVPVASGWYNIYSQGVFIFGSTYPWAYADAEWVQIYENQWSEYSYDGYPDHSTELSINGNFFDWEGQLADGSYAVHIYSENHNYRVNLYTPGGLDFWIYDGYYVDNIGGLEVTIEAVPEPSSLIALGALLTPLLAFRRKR